MKRNKLVASKHWITEDQGEYIYYHLFVEVLETSDNTKKGNKTFYKKFRVLSRSWSSDVVKLNKKLKEFDVLDSIRTKFGVRKAVFQ